MFFVGVLVIPLSMLVATLTLCVKNGPWGRTRGWVYLVAVPTACYITLVHLDNAQADCDPCEGLAAFFDPISGSYLAGVALTLVSLLIESTAAFLRLRKA